MAARGSAGVRLDRRALLGGLAASLAAPPTVRAQGVMMVDGAGRLVLVPGRVERLYPAGPPAAILIYTLAPDFLIGWTRDLTADERRFLDPEAGARPGLGRLTGDEQAIDAQKIAGFDPDMIIDYGSVSDRYMQLADKVSGLTGIPYMLLDGRIEAIAGTYRLLADVTGRRGRAATLAAYADDLVTEMKGKLATIGPDAAPKIYYARGADGLGTAGAQSSLTEVFAFLKLRNVAAGKGGLAQASVEEIRAWDPDLIVAEDPGFADRAKADPGWSGLRAVAAGRVATVPRLPFGWLEPPSVNRLIGLQWLAALAYPTLFPDTTRFRARGFYELFYGVPPSEEDIAAMIGAVPRSAP